MADPRFYSVSSHFSLEQLSGIAEAEIGGTRTSGKAYTDVAPLASAGPMDVSFIDNRRYVSEFKVTQAGAVLVPPDLVDQAPSTAALLITQDPYKGYARVAQAYYPNQDYIIDQRAEARVDAQATIDSTAVIGAGAHIGSGAEIGALSVVGPNAVIGRGVVIGENCHIGANVTVAFALIGNGVRIHPGVSIGQDGFGFAPGATGHEKVPQLGRVIINDNVEIGANTTIDRGTGPDTVIGAGSKIDNLVQIAHNVQIGEHCLIAAQTGISGSSIFGDFVMVGGQAGISGHLKVGSGVRIAGQSGVTKDVSAGTTIVGFPATETREYWRKAAVLNRLAKEGEGK